MKTDFISLNQSQLKAVTTINGPSLVIAGAGSGKTRVIEYRVLHLIENKIEPGSILLLTFTRKAAREMLSRASAHNIACRDVEGGTFHSFGYKILRKYARTIGLANTFLVLDGADSEEAVHKCGVKMGLFSQERKFPRKETLRNVISTSINKGLSIEDILEKDFPHFLNCAEEINALKAAYQEYKKKHSYVDYDDLLIYLICLLKNEETGAAITRKFQFVMVDEYQDTNKLQAEIVYLLAKEHKNVMAVGDDAQSIYGFRGATHKNIMEFPRRFSGCSVIKLEENYRSTQAILDTCNVVLENMRDKYSKCLLSTRKERGEKPQIRLFRNINEEAEFIVNRIRELTDEGTALEKQAVLFRSSHISIPLQAELTRRSIPYQVFGGVRFYETAHVKDVLSHLRIISNHRDELAWSRALLLIEGIGPKTADRLITEIVTASNLKSALEKIERADKSHKYSNDLLKLKMALTAASGKKMGVSRQFEIILDYYIPILKNKFDNWNARLNDLKILGQLSGRYKTLNALLAELSIEPMERGVETINPSEPREERPLTLSTIHSAKGLEWNTVFLIGLIDGVLPSSLALDDAEEIEEEHRLLYVAITRAKDRLFLSLYEEGRIGGAEYFKRVSRFINAPDVLSKLEGDVFWLSQTSHERSEISQEVPFP